MSLCGPCPWAFLFGVAAEGVSVETEGFVLPDGPSFYLAKKKQKCDLWAAPLRTRLSKKVKVKGRGRVKGKMTPCSHLRLRTVAGTLQPDVVGVEEPMVKGGGGG